jgi:hypothetical protein
VIEGKNKKLTRQDFCHIDSDERQHYRDVSQVGIKNGNDYIDVRTSLLGAEELP